MKEWRWMGWTRGLGKIEGKGRVSEGERAVREAGIKDGWEMGWGHQEGKMSRRQWGMQVREGRAREGRGGA